MKLDQLAKQFGITTYREFDVIKLIPTDWVRAFCFQNKCGNYGNNYMCPPLVGSLEELKLKLA